MKRNLLICAAMIDNRSADDRMVDNWGKEFLLLMHTVNELAVQDLVRGNLLFYFIYRILIPF